MDISIDNLIARISTISPTARRYIDGAKWKVHVDEDEVGQRTVLNNLFYILIDECLELGIEAHCNINELCDNLYHMHLAISLLELIMPSPLYRSYVLQDIVYKLLTTNEDTGECSIISLMHGLLRYDYDKYSEMVTFCVDKFISTPVFDNYCNTLFNKNGTTAVEPMGESLVNYLVMVNTTYDQLINICTILNTQLGTYKTVDIEDTIYNAAYSWRTIVTDPSNIDDYAWSWVNEHNVLTSDSEIALLKKITNRYLDTSPYFLQHYINNKLIITPVILVLLQIGVCIHSDTVDTFRTNIGTILNTIVDTCRIEHTSTNKYTLDLWNVTADILASTIGNS